jgi:small subunit ribosomal protein S13
MVEENKDNQIKTPVVNKVSEPIKSTFKHIVRIANVDVPGGKPVRIAMKKIKGIGLNIADTLCVIAGINKQTKAGNLNEGEVKKLNETIKNINSSSLPKWMLNRRKDYESGDDKHVLTGDLVYAKDNDLKRLKKIKAYRGVRHSKGLPVRGQRTRSNFRKSKGKVVGVRKKTK